MTEIVDLEMAHNLAIWKRRMQKKNFDILRVRFGMYREHIDDAISVGLESGDGIEGCPLLTVGPFKIIVRRHFSFLLAGLLTMVFRPTAHLGQEQLIVTKLTLERKILANSSIPKKRYSR